MISSDKAIYFMQPQAFHTSTDTGYAITDKAMHSQTRLCIHIQDYAITDKAMQLQTRLCNHRLGYAITDKAMQPQTRLCNHRLGYATTYKTMQSQTKPCNYRQWYIIHTTTDKSIQLQTRLCNSCNHRHFIQSQTRYNLSATLYNKAIYIMQQNEDMFDIWI